MSFIKDLKEHLDCNNYQHKKNSIIELVLLPSQEQKLWKTLGNKIIAVMEGNILADLGSWGGLEVSTNNLFFVHAGQEIRIQAFEDAKIVIFRIEENRQLCKCYTFEHLYTALDHEPEGDRILPFNKQVCDYMSFLLNLLEQCAKCTTLQKMKIQELFYILRLFYTKQQIASLIAPVLSGNITFTEKLLEKAKTAVCVQEMADAVQLSVPGFKDKFRKIYGTIPPYRWLQKQKSLRVYQLLAGTDLPFKEIQRQEGFSNITALTRFCKTYLEATPMEIRSREK